MTNNESPSSAPPTRCQFVRKAFRLLKSWTGLFCILILYIILGGWIFSHLEAPNSQLEAKNVDKTREKFLEDIHLASQGRNWTEESRELLRLFEEEFVKAFERGAAAESHGGWTMLRGVTYSISIITTIGYGHITPMTFHGRLATLLYAIPGIPLCLLVLAHLGRLVTKLIKRVLLTSRRVYHWLHCTREISESADDLNEHFNFTPIVAISILLVYLLSCSALYMYFENWSYSDSVYFLFISVSTIGLGDLIPHCERQAWFLVVSTILVFIGLSLVSMVINVIAELVTWLLEEAHRMSGEVYQIGARVRLNLKGENEEPDKVIVDEEIDKMNDNEESVS